MACRLRMNHMKNPLGFALERLSISFWPEKELEFYKVEVAEDESFGKIVFTSMIPSQMTHAFLLEFVPQKAVRYYWRIFEGSKSSETAWFETPISLDDVPAITPVFYEYADSAVLIREFQCSKEVQKARLYISGLGLYEAFLDDDKIGNEYLAPGFTVYDKTVQYQTYDVTAQLKQGTNRLEVLLGNGWYKGRFGMGESRCIYGDTLLCKAVLVIDYTDGTQERIQTDENWKARQSVVGRNSIYDGEWQNATVSQAADQKLCCVRIMDDNHCFIPRRSLPVVEKFTLKPELLMTPKAEKVLDFGQNISGFVRFSCPMKKGDKIRLQAGEILQNGCFYRDNLRSAKAEFVYESDGVQRTVYPHFTYYGFRYMLVEGLEEINPAWFEGVVIYTDLSDTARITTSSEKLNRLLQNAVWSQRGNFIDIPTDCPQRDERLGWTGDAQVFSATACLQMDSQPFFEKWLKDLEAEQQTCGGAVPLYVPALRNPYMKAGAVWGDAAIIIPMNLYEMYGDLELLKKHYPMMKAYLEYVRSQDAIGGNTRLYHTGVQLGDWLALDGVTSQSRKGGTEDTFVASAYYYHGTKQVAKAAGLLGYTQDCEKYEILAKEIKQAFMREYLTDTGRLAMNTQTGYVLCLLFGLYDDEQKMTEGFIDRLQRDLYQIRAGFAGAPLILDVLFEHHMEREAYRLLLNEDFPGWLYEVNMGATTIWERWNAILPDGTISGTQMNSMNHYSYGCVANTVYTYIAGLRPVDTAWRRVRIAPMICTGLNEVSAVCETVCGVWKTAWTLECDNTVTVDVTIPANCTAELILPGMCGEKKELHAGSYSFCYTAKEALNRPYGEDSILMDLFKDPRAAALIEEYLPALMRLQNTQEPDDLAKPIRDIACRFPYMCQSDKLKECVTELNQLIVI